MSRDMRYLKNQEKFLDYSYSMFGDYFNSFEQLQLFFESIKDDTQKNKFLKISGFLKFLVQDGRFVNTDPNFPEYIDYLDLTYKFIGLFSLIEALFTEEENIDFYQWIMRVNKRRKDINIFPINGKTDLEKLYIEYKKNYGFGIKAILFVRSLDEDDRKFLENSIQFINVQTRQRTPSDIDSVAKYLYDLRSKFVHRADLAGSKLGVSFTKIGKEWVQVSLSIEDLIRLYKKATINYFKKLQVDNPSSEEL